MEEKLYPRRWAILVGMSILLLATNFAFVLPGGAAVLVMIEYQCEPMQFSMIMSIPYLAGVLFCFAGGSLSDRLGMGRVFAVSFIITLIACIVRIFVHGYWVLFAVMFFMGAGNAVLNANSAKLLRLWFPGPSNSFAMGVYVAMLSLGAAIALVFGSHIDDIYFGWKVSAAFMAVGVAAWFIAYRDHPDGEAQSEASISEFLGDALKNRYVWGISVFAFLWFGTTTLNSQYMTAALTALIGDPSLTGEAGNLSSINTLLTCIGSIVMPLVWAKFFKKNARSHAFCDGCASYYLGNSVLSALRSDDMGAVSDCCGVHVRWFCFCKVASCFASGDQTRGIRCCRRRPGNLPELGYVPVRSLYCFSVGHSCHRCA